ncbi:hypothetical protein [Ruegeria sp. A3M17]|uniref:hypothetical protein n=1 Tax=Ruegeria sp. A3M17 TaxID=2267229 RepID=UPI0018F7CCB2|nr:hypothetical protein [Ruegeria sp. A3M17]
MPITLSRFSEEDCYFGNSWQVTDEDELARQIGVIALGYSHHVLKILQGTGVVDADYPADGVASAIELLTVSGEDSSHRDGWMFQAMSWIAAIRANPTAKLAAPHMQHADKGFDGLQVEIDDETRRVKCAVISPGNCGRKAVEAIVNTLPHSDVLKWRLGSKEAKRHLRVAQKYQTVERPYERIELDCTEADIILADERGNPIGRPHVCAAIDCATGWIVALIVTLHKPTAEDVAKATRGSHPSCASRGSNRVCEGARFC